MKNEVQNDYKPFDLIREVHQWFEDGFRKLGSRYDQTHYDAGHRSTPLTVFKIDNGLYTISVFYPAYFKHGILDVLENEGYPESPLHEAGIPWVPTECVNESPWKAENCQHV